MRHRRRHKSLHRSKSVHKAFLRSMAQSLLLHGRVETTLQKAKEARREIDRLITLGKDGSLVARRKALEILGKPEPLHLLFKEIAPLFKKRQGGYTRVVRSLTRVGDGVQLANLELTEQRPLPQKEKKVKEVKEKKTPETKEAKPEPKATKPAFPKPAPSLEPKSQKETPPAGKKPSGFLGSLRRFLKPKDRSSS